MLGITRASALVSAVGSGGSRGLWRWRLREGEYPAKITQVARGRARIHVMRFGVTPKLLEPLNVRV